MRTQGEVGETGYYIPYWKDSTVGAPVGSYWTDTGRTDGPIKQQRQSITQ